MPSGIVGACTTKATRRARSRRLQRAPPGARRGRSVAARRRTRPASEPQQRRLAGAVRADDRHPLAVGDREVDAAQDSAGRRASTRAPAELDHRLRRPQDEDEERRAEERRDDADGDLGRRGHGAGDQVGEHEERPAEEERQREDHPVAGADEQPHGVGHDDADEGDEARDRHRGRGAAATPRRRRPAGCGGRARPSDVASSSPTASTSSERRWSEQHAPPTRPRTAAPGAPRPTRRSRGARGSSCRPRGSCPGCAAARRSAPR